MATNPQQSYMTVEEYLELDNESPDARYDYIDGQVIRLAGGTPQHSLIAVNLTIILSQLLRANNSPCRVFNSDVKVRFSASRYVHPDLAVSCDERDWADPESIQYPGVVVEVLSHSTEARDRGQKFADYRACQSIQEYALVNYAYQEIELYRRERGHLWSFQTFLPGVDVELASLGLHFPVTDVYEGIIIPGGSDDQPA